MTEPEHDPHVGQLLEGLAVPDHRPDFWETLDARMTGATMSPTTIPADTTTAAVDDGNVIDVTDRHRRRGRRTIGLVVAAAAVAGLVAIGSRELTDGRSPVVADSPATTTTVSPQRAGEIAAEDVVQRFLAALGRGDTTAAADLLGPRSEAYLQATTGSVDEFLHSAVAGYGAWATVPDRRVHAVTVRPGDVVVVVEGTHRGDGTPAERAEAFPVRHAESTDAWFVEPWAFDPAVGGRMELLRPDPATTTPTMHLSEPAEVAVPDAGRAWFSFDSRQPTEVAPAVTDHGRTARWYPQGPVGRHVLLVVFESERTFTALARIVELGGATVP